MLYPVQWSSTTYGLDGPWNAVSAEVGGYSNTSRAAYTQVDLLPGGFWQTYILSDAVCTPSNATTDCAKGGSWNPLTASNGALAQQTVDNRRISLPGTQNNFLGSGRSLSGQIYSQKIHLNGVRVNNYPELTVPNSTLVSATTAYHTWPNGRTTSLQLGSLALGADDQEMVFGDSSTVPIRTWNIPGYLRNTSDTSDSYTIQIGAAHLGYPGSLIFGGYDKGRGLGPITSWSGSPLMLHDITLGVETGGSPWNFTSKTGLLLNNQTQPSQLPVYPDPIAPYLHLPDATCRGLANVLPLYFDQTSKYYLWNTSDPMYTKTLTSATYLGFVFPAFGATDDITIKVPLLYLNRTLQPAASGLNNPVQYFPCQNYVPDYSSVKTGGSSGGTYTLGRAFLQAAILGRNWEQGVSWMAQAPGPGSGNQGLGYNPVEIGNKDTSISFDPDTSLFNKTMQKFWTPLPGPASTGGSTGSTGGNDSITDTGLSTGAKAGIGAGVAVLVLVLIAAVVFYVMRRKRKSTVPVSAPMSYYDDTKSPANAAVQPLPRYEEARKMAHQPVMYNGHAQPAEVLGSVPAAEVPGTVPAAELDAGYVRYNR